MRGALLKIWQEGQGGGSLSQNMRRIWGELKMLSKNTCEGLHLIKKLPAISLQASKFTARMPPAHYGKPCTYSDFSETSVSGEHIGILMQSNSKAILNHYFPSLNLFCKWCVTIICTNAANFFWLCQYHFLSRSTSFLTFSFTFVLTFALLLDAFKLGKN